MKPENRDFPEVKGKVVESVQISVESDYYGISLRFQDKTSLTFVIESCVIASRLFEDWTSGEAKMLKEYKPVRSEVSPETEVGLRSL